MSFTLAQLKTAIQDYTDNSETSFVAHLPDFIKSSEDAYKVNLIFGVSLFVVYLFFWIKIYLKNRINFIWSGFEKLFFRFKENFEFFLSSIAGHISIHSGLIILKLFVDNLELGPHAISSRRSCKIGLSCVNTAWCLAIG